MSNTKILLSVAALASTSLAQSPIITDPVCASSIASFFRVAPTPSPDLASYIASIRKSSTFTAPGKTTALPGVTLEDPEGYEALYCSIGANLPKSLVPAFTEYASGLLSFGSAHESEYDAYVTDCITTGEAAASITSALHAMFTGGSDRCQSLSSTPQYATTTNAVCLSKLADIAKGAPTPSPELGSYLASVIGTGPVTAPGYSTALPPNTLEDPEAYQALFCSIAEDLPETLLPAFKEHAEQLLSYGSAHESAYDAYITDCIATGERAASLTSALHAMFTGGPAACQSTPAPGGSSYPVPTSSGSTPLPTAAAARPTGAVIGAAALGGLLGAVALL